MKEITYNINFTISKIMGIVIILGGLALGFYLKNDSIAITLVTVGGGLIGLKTVIQNKKL